jgi:DNA-binding PadR family transcriptional regulator
MQTVARTMADFRDPHEYVPLRPVEFEVLLVLAGGDAHGYGIIKEARDRGAGGSRIDTGTLYRTLRRLTMAGMVEPSDERPASESDDERRRYYAVTPFGRAVAGAEARRLSVQVDAARALELLAGGDGKGGRT